MPLNHVWQNYTMVHALQFTAHLRTSVIIDHGLKKVSIDRLKCAYVLTEETYKDYEQIEKGFSTSILEKEHNYKVIEAKTTGRKVRLPNRFHNYILTIVGHK